MWVSKEIQTWLDSSGKDYNTSIFFMRMKEVRTYVRRLDTKYILKKKKCAFLYERIGSAVISCDKIRNLCSLWLRKPFSFLLQAYSYSYIIIIIIEPSICIFIRIYILLIRKWWMILLTKYYGNDNEFVKVHTEKKRK